VADIAFPREAMVGMMTPEEIWIVKVILMLALVAIICFWKAW